MQPKTKSGYLTNPHSLSHVYLLVRLNQHSLTPSLRNTEIPIIPRGCYIRSSWLLFLISISPGNENKERQAERWQNLSDFHIPGTFSRVYLCTLKKKTEQTNGQQYQALKVLPINEVIRHNQVQHVNNEREILQVRKNTNYLSPDQTLHFVLLYSEDQESVRNFCC